VAVMMAVAEATHDNGTLLGAVVTFVLYGLVPVLLVLYLMGTPTRRRANKAREESEWQQAQHAARPSGPASGEPDAGRHAATATEGHAVTAVRKEP
jgi:Mg2+/citrate symporter